MALKCGTCGVSIYGQDNFVKFECPSCGEEIIIRCRVCKKNGREFTCKKCGFVGP